MVGAAMFVIVESIRSSDRRRREPLRVLPVGAPVVGPSSLGYPWTVIATPAR
jgi:hypothetical protein